VPVLVSALQIYVRLGAGAPAARLLAQIHDELLFEVPEAQVGATAAAVRQVMEGRGSSVCCAALHSCRPSSN
jgi:DNA polymerase I-like protein with 3'-5' exonuclease and polymerase domains